MSKKQTVFQALDKAINGNWGRQDAAVVPHVNSYDMSSHGKDIIYRTTNKDDYEQKKLELQQDKYLKDRWVKANVNLSVTAFAGLNNIKLMYRDADLMDAFPEIGAALDIVSEEASITNGGDGMVVHVSSKSERVKSILEDLFVNRLNLQLTAQMIIRAMAKYGNQFMLLNIDRKNGVMGWKQLPVFNVERIENGIQNPYGAGASIAVNGVNSIDPSDLSTQFVWLDDNNSQVPFREWQVAHFRLLSNSLYLPYGCLVGDTRIETEDGYKEIQDIEIGDKVWTFNVDTQERELSEVTMWMPKGEKEVYEIYTKHHYLQGTPDHKILTSDGVKLEYKDIKDIKAGDLVAIRQGVQGNGHPIKIDKSIPLLRQRPHLWFSPYVDRFPEYVNEEIAEFIGYMIGDGSITYKRIINIAGGVSDIFNDKYQEVAERLSGRKCKRVYRKDGSLLSIVCQSRFLGEMLLRMGYICGYHNKRIPSWVYQAESSIKKAFIRGLINADGYMFLDRRRPNSPIRYDIEVENEQLMKDLKILCQSLGYKTGQIFKRHRKPHYSKKIGHMMNHTYPSYELSFYETPNTQEKCNDIQGRLTNDFQLEKVRKVEYAGQAETYDITVDSPNSNFFANGIITHNCSYLNAARRHWRMLSLMEDMMLIYRLERSIERRVYKIYVGAIDDADIPAYIEQVANEFKRTPIIDPMTGQVDLRKNILSVADDIFVPTRSENSPTPIDTLAPAQNLTAMDDIKFVQNKVLTALRIPKTFLNFEENAGDGKNLALMDIRFTRTINRIQQAFLMELTRVASIHLFLLGFDDELTNFTLSMNNPSTQAEQLEIENMQKKIDAVRDAVSDPGNGLPVMSLMRALREIMKWSDKQIKENFEEIRLEKGIAAELEKTPQIIQRTGVFDKVDRIYGEPGAEYAQDQQGQGGMGDAMGGSGGMGGGPAPSMDSGSDLDGLGAPGADDTGDINGQEGSMPTGEMPLGNEENQQQQPMENSLRKKPLINESKVLDELFNRYLKQLDEAKDDKDNAKTIRAGIYDKKSLLLSEEFDKMIGDLSKYVDEE